MKIVIKQWIKEFLAELFGTFILVVFGCSAVASQVLNHNSNSFNIAFGFGFGLFIAVIITGPVSGAHLNPAVTVALAVLNKFKWKKLIHYIIGQYLGAFLAAGTVYAVYYQAIEQLEQQAWGIAHTINGTFDRVELTGGIFSTFPHRGISIGFILTDQIISTALLMIAILGITESSSFQNSLEKSGSAVPKYFQPLALALSLLLIILCFGFNCGAPLNPARDLGPRIFSALIGYGPDVFKPLEYHYWWTGGVVGPHLGAVIGGWIYQFAIGIHLNDNDQLGIGNIIGNHMNINMEIGNDNDSSSYGKNSIKNHQDIISERARQVINESLNFPSLNHGTKERTISTSHRY